MMVAQTQENSREVRQVVRRPRAGAGPIEGADARAAVNRIARAWLLGALIVGLGVALFLRFYSTHFTQLPSADAMHVAQVARSVAAGRGLKSAVICPMHFGLGEAEHVRHDIGVGPLYPAALGIFFQGRGAEDSAVALFNGILLLMTAAFLYGLIKLVYDKPIAIWAVLAYFVSMQAISQALTGGGASIGALVVTAALYFGMLAVTNAQTPPEPRTEGAPRSLGSELVRAYRSPWPWVVLAGVSVGLSYLTGQVGWLAIGVLVWVAVQIGERRWRPAVVIAVLALLLIGPWAARNMKYFGSPVTPLQRYSLLMFTQDYPGRSYLWQLDGLPDSPALWAITHPGQMLRKIGGGLTTAYGTIPGLMNQYLFPFFVAGIFVVAKTPRQRLLWGATWAILGAQVLTAALYDRDADPLAAVTPLGLALAVATLVGLMRQHITHRRALLGVGIAAAAVVAFPYVASSVMGSAPPPDPAKPAYDLLATLPDQAAGERLEWVIATNVPWEVAWYSGKRAFLLPPDAQQLKAMAKAGPEPHMIYLSAALRSAQVEKGREQWARLLVTGQGMDELQVSQLQAPAILPNGDALISLASADPWFRAIRRAAGADAAEPEGGEAPGGSGQ
ncbi:MAG: ArnT family glycosyltransferase [Armatimonadota bacterium]